MSIHQNEEMQKNGFLIYPFPSDIREAMLKQICCYIGVDHSSDLSEARLIDELTKRLQSYSDEAFVKRFAKAFRMFPDSVTAQVNKWVEGLALFLGGSRAGINYVSLEERATNPRLREDSYDVFWRCVRPGKPDVGAAHCDYQFWELAKGTPQDVGCPFTYDERWKIWTPLLGCDATNSLQVVAESHREEVPIDKILTKNGYKPVIREEWLRFNERNFVCPLKLYKDECVLFHDKLVHRGPQNTSNTLRLSGELTILLKR
jgi:hypothetical protein